MRSNSSTIMPIAATAAAVQRRACGSHPLEKNLAAAVVAVAVVAVAVAVAVAVGVGVVAVAVAVGVVVVVSCDASEQNYHGLMCSEMVCPVFHTQYVAPWFLRNKALEVLKACDWLVGKL